MPPAPTLRSQLLEQLRRVTILGVDPTLPRQQTRHVVLTNQYALFFMLATGTSGLGPTAYALLPRVRVLLGLGFLVALLALALNARRFPTVANVVLLGGQLVVLVTIGTLEPAETEHIVFPVMIAIVSWFVFPARQRAWSVVCSLLAALSILGLSTYLARFPPPPQHPDFDAHGIALGNVLVFFFALVFFSHRTVREIDLVEAELLEERRNTERLLKREVAHQVAERSRELGEALQRDAGSPLPSFGAGTGIGSRYRVVRPLGQGGMGAVIEVERLTDHQHFALKVMTGDLSREHAARFAREAEIGARVHHENLVSILDVGVTEGGAPYLVMELAHGGALEGKRESFGDAAWALPILRQIAAGLLALHEAGVVHRDLKPANVLLEAQGRAMLSDFGIARFSAIPKGLVDPHAPTAADVPRGRDLTGTGAWVGTPLYMAPEAASGGREVGPAADVFAFGLIAFELLTGRLPFATPPVLLALAGQPVPALPPLHVEGLDAATSAAILACLVTDPAARPDARSLWQAFA